MRGGTILAVDDDQELLALVRSELEAFNYEVVEATDGGTALEIALSVKPDLVILDISLPVLDGFSVCRELRAKSSVPILILSSLREDYDKIVGLELGADDYLGKPCNPRELLARVRALLRRSRLGPTPEPEATLVKSLQVGTLTLDPATYQATSDGEPLFLTPIEFSLLEALMQVSPGVMPRAQLSETIWGPNFVANSRALDTHVRNIRRKLGPEAPVLEVVRSVGFRLTAP